MSLIIVNGCVNKRRFIYFMFESRKQQQWILEGNNVIRRRSDLLFHHIVYKHALGLFSRSCLWRNKGGGIWSIPFPRECFSAIKSGAFEMNHFPGQDFMALQCIWVANSRLHKKLEKKKRNNTFCTYDLLNSKRKHDTVYIFLSKASPLFFSI